MKSRIGKAIVILGVAVAAAAASGCSSGASQAPSAAQQQTGTVGVLLTLPGGAVINSVQVVISGPTAKTFTADVSQASGVVQSDGTVAINLGTTAGLAPGAYTVTISGVSTDGTVTCTGSPAPFTVVANATANVSAFASCRTGALDAGSVTIGGDFSNCGRVTSISNSLGEVTVGGSITVNGSSTGPNPGALTWTFAASPADGTFAPSTGTGGSPTTAFTCTAPGTVTLSLTVADGTVPSTAPSCSDVDSKSITVVCDASGTTSSTSSTTTSSTSSTTSSTSSTTTTSSSSTSSTTSPTAAADAHCATQNAGAPCSPTELLFVEKDTNAATGAAISGAAFGCYDCLVGAGCLDDKVFSSDVDHECADTGPGGITNPTLSGDAASTSCLALVSCVLGGNCSSANGSGTCYCGTAVGSACTVAGGPNGTCLAQEQDGTNSTSPPTVNQRFTDISYAGGMANTLFSCAGSNSCSQCFP